MIRYLIHRPTTDGKVYAVIAGLSTDTKPTAGLITGSRFVEADTGTRYMFDESAGQWNETQFQDQIDAAVQAWLEDHPEAIDQAAIEAMFGDQLDGIESDLSGLKSALWNDEDLYDKQYNVVSHNLFNKDSVLNGFRVMGDGSIVTNSSYWISRRIPVTAGVTYYIWGDAGIYTSDGAFLHFHSVDDAGLYEMPSTASYIICSGPSLYLGMYRLNEGQSYEYDAYKAVFKTNIIPIDTTLTEAGTPADAKTVGESIATAKTDAIDATNSIADGIWETETKSGSIVNITDSAINKAQAIETTASKLYRSGINIWDEEWENGYYSTANGSAIPDSGSVRSKNSDPIPVHPNTEYYVKAPYNGAYLFYQADGTYISYVTDFNAKITTPANCYYMRFYLVGQYGATYNNDVQITFDANTEKTTYHAHKTATFDSASELTLLPKEQNYIFAIGTSDTIEITYYKGENTEYIPKKPYQSGYQIFTVPVNQTIPDLSDTAATTNDNENTMVDVECYIKLPSSYTPNGKPTRLLMICHGAGRGVTTDADEITGWIELEGYNRIVDAFINAGYAVFDCNGYKNNQLGTSFWGAPRGVEAWRKAYDYVTREYNVEHDFSIYAFSMGGLTAFELMGTMFPNIRAVAMASPVTSMEDAWNRGTNAAVIKQNYGLPNSVSEFDPSYFKGCDPIQSIIEINSTEYWLKLPMPPVKIWFGSLETEFPKKSLAEQVVSAIQNANGIAQYREVYNVDHTLCTGGVPAIIPEFVYWINRFNCVDD